eukprot:Em0003g63a
MQVWKARVMGYEEAVKHFKKQDDENSPEYNVYAGLLKKFVVDSNAAAQEKGVEATLAFLESAAPSIGGRVVGDVMAGVVTKCLNARPKTKEASVNICLMCIEIEKQEVVQEELIKGLTNKQPKIVVACIEVLRMGLEQFGAKVMNVKALMKVLPSLFEHSDQADEYKMAARKQEDIQQRATVVMGIDWNSKPLDTPLPEIGSTAGTQERKGEEKRKVKVQPNENTNPSPAMAKAATKPVDKPPSTAASAGAPPPTAGGGLSVNLDDLRKRLERIKAST